MPTVERPALGLWKKLGPGLVRGASEDDRGGMGTYGVAGAAWGYGTLWTAVLTLPLMVAVQLVCARIGMVCGIGLTGAIRRHYPQWLLTSICLVLLSANVFNIAADLAGMADAIAMLVAIPELVSVPLLGVAIIAFTIFSRYETFAKYVKWSKLELLSYVAASLLARPDWREALRRSSFPQINWPLCSLTIL